MHKTLVPVTVFISAHSTIARKIPLDSPHTIVYPYCQTISTVIGGS